MTSNAIELVPQESFERQQHRSKSAWSHLYELLDSVTDPEIPVISIWDLGVLQDITVSRGAGQERISVTITPTYSGCPAMQQITQDVETTLNSAGFFDIEIIQQLTPAWTTDWMTPSARKRLRAYGIAPPDDSTCPQCGSEDISVISEFGSTSCKAQLRCNTCLEPFDQFKTI